MKRWAIIAAGLFLLLVPAPITFAAHGTDFHWHDASFEYQVRPSIPSGWHTAIRTAKNNWNTGLDDVSLSEDSDSLNWVERKEMPGGKCGDDGVACSLGYESDDPDHLGITDIILNEDTDFGTNTLNCAADRPDVEEAMIHEFGHAAGWLDHTSEAKSVMRPRLNGGCFRVPITHDYWQMDNQVSGNH